MKSLLTALFFSLLFIQLNAQIDISNIEAIVDSLYKDHIDQPGGMVGIVKDGNIILSKAYGKANLDYDIASSENSVQDLGSMAMHMTAACILSLDSEGKLKLNDPIHKYLPDLPKYEAGKITIQNLLNHTGGVKDYIVLNVSAGKPINANHNQDATYQLIKRQKSLTIVPGSEYRYSSSGYVLLAQIVEKVSAQRFSEYISERFFEPFGMSNSFVYDDHTRIIRNRAIGYESENEQFKVDNSYNFNVYGDGRIYSTLSDMLKWSIAIKKEQLGGRTLYDLLIQRGVLSDGTQMTYANGLEFTEVNGHTVFAHSGYFGAFSCMFIDFTDLDVSIITLTNNGDISAPGKAYDLAERIISAKPSKDSNFQTESGFETMTLNTSNLEEYTGDYFSRKYGYIRSINLVNDTLQYVINENVQRKLVPISQNEFRYNGIPHYNSFRFTNADKLELRIQMGENAPYHYTRYKKADFHSEAAEEYLGSFYAKELDVHYEIKAEDDRLKAFVNGEEIITFEAIMKDHFTSAHDGFLAYERVGKRIIGFTLNDYSLGAIKFQKVDSDAVNQ